MVFQRYCCWVLKRVTGLHSMTLLSSPSMVFHDPPSLLCGSCSCSNPTRTSQWLFSQLQFLDLFDGPFMLASVYTTTITVSRYPLGLNFKVKIILSFGLLLVYYDIVVAPPFSFLAPRAAKELPPLFLLSPLPHRDSFDLKPFQLYSSLGGRFPIPFSFFPILMFRWLHMCV